MYNMELSNVKPSQILLLVSFLDMFSVGMLLPQLNQHAKSLGGNFIVIGLMSALYSASQLTSGPVVGSLSDIRGRKPILLITLSVCAIAYLISGLTSSIYIFVALRTILGLVKQTQLLSKALVPDYVKDVNIQSETYGRMNSLSGIGMAGGPIVGGHIMEAYPYHGFTLIITFVVALFVVNLGLVNSLPDITKQKKDKKDKDTQKKIPTNIASKLLDSIKGQIKESIDEFYKINWQAYGDIFLLKLFMTLSMGMYFTNFSLFLKSIHAVSFKNLGYIVAFQGLTGSLCTYFIGYVNKLYQTDKDYSQRNYHVFIIVASTLFLLAISSNAYIYTVLLIPLAIASSVSRVVTLEMLTSRTVDSNRGTIIGSSNSIRSLSGVFLPLVAGVINQYLGVVYTFYCAALFATVGVAVSRRIRLSSLEAKNK